MRWRRESVSMGYWAVHRSAGPIWPLVSVAILDHGRLRSLPNASRTFFTKWRTDKVFRIHFNDNGSTGKEHRGVMIFDRFDRRVTMECNPSTFSSLGFASTDHFHCGPVFST